MYFYFFFFNDPATTEIYTLSLHDALPIFSCVLEPLTADYVRNGVERDGAALEQPKPTLDLERSEEHTSELQSRLHLVCRLLLEKKKTTCTSLIPRRPRTTPRDHR